MKKYFNLYKKQFILGPAFKLAEAILELFVPITVARTDELTARISEFFKEYYMSFSEII